jgi:hypothetical protein
MASVDWSARPDQIEGLALREVGVSDPIFLSLDLLLISFPSVEICPSSCGLL